MSEESGGWRRIGDSLLRVEPPDLLFVRDRGTVLPEHIAAIVEEARQLASGGPPLWLMDMSELGEVPAPTRKFIAKSDLLSLVGGAAVIGATFAHRVIVKLVINVGKLARPGAPSPEIRYFASEAEARAWLDEVRRSRVSRGPRGSGSAGDG